MALAQALLKIIWPNLVVCHLQSCNLIIPLNLWTIATFQGKPYAVSRFPELRVRFFEVTTRLLNPLEASEM
jgi:hypothetical protein